MQGAKSAVVFGALVLGLALTAGGAAGDTPRGALEGISGLEVVVMALPPELIQQGLTAAAVRTAVAEQLHASGIPDEHSATHLLAVTVGALRAAGRVAMHVQLEVSPRVRLADADQGVAMPHSRWRVEGVSLIEQPAAAAVCARVLEYVDRFIRAYREQNPPQ